MLRISNKNNWLITVILNILLCTPVYAADMDRAIIAAGGEKGTIGSNSLIYTFGQAFSSSPSASLQIGFLPGLSPSPSSCPIGINKEWACVAFQGLEPTYEVGDTLKVNLIENVNVTRFTQVYLWVAIQTPAALRFRTPIALEPFSDSPQPWKESVQNSDILHNLLDVPLVEGIGGEYTLYGLYVKTGTNPMEHLDNIEAIQRSNLAIEKTTLAYEPGFYNGERVSCFDD